MKNDIELKNIGLVELSSHEYLEMNGGWLKELFYAYEIADAIKEFGTGVYDGFTRTWNEIHK